MKLSKTCFYPDKPSKAQLSKLTIDELFILAKQKRSIKHPFKKVLVNYLYEVGIR